MPGPKQHHHDPLSLDDLDEEQAAHGDQHDPLSLDDLDDPSEHEAQQVHHAVESHRPGHYEEPWYEALIGGAAAAGNGVLHNWGGEIAHGATRGLNALGLTHDDPDEAERAIDQASREHPTAHGLGQVGSDVGAALLTKGGVGAQAGLAAAQGAVAEQGSSHDPLESLLAAGRGGVVGALGAGIGKLAGRAIGGVQETGDYVAQQASKLPSFGAMASGAAKAAQFIPGMRGAGRVAGHVIDGLRSMAGKGGEDGGAVFAPELTYPGMELGAKLGGVASRVAEKAYATPETFDWVTKSVLASPKSGLSQEQQQALNQAVLSGDAKQAAALSYQYRQQSPAFARQYEKTMRGLNGDQDE